MGRGENRLGLLLRARALFAKRVDAIRMHFDPAAQEMKQGIFSVLPEVFICRCTGCQSIVASALDAAARLRSERTA